MNPALFLTHKNFLGFTENSAYVTSMNPRLSNEEKSHYARSGYMLCDERPAKFTTTETYYVMNQKVSPGQLLDNMTDQNRPLFMVIRGEHDFVNFMSSLHESAGFPEGFADDYQTTMLMTDPTIPLFLRGWPNSPGVITSSE